jgi:hypothetical protein
VSRRTEALSRILQGNGLYQKLNRVDRRKLADMLDQAYRAGQWSVQQDASVGLQVER